MTCGGWLRSQEEGGCSIEWECVGIEISDPDTLKIETMNEFREMLMREETNASMLAVDSTRGTSAVLCRRAGHDIRLSTRETGDPKAHPRIWSEIRRADWAVLEGLAGQVAPRRKFFKGLVRLSSEAH